MRAEEFDRAVALWFVLEGCFIDDSIALLSFVGFDDLVLYLVWPQAAVIFFSFYDIWFLLLSLASRLALFYGIKVFGILDTIRTIARSCWASAQELARCP